MIQDKQSSAHLWIQKMTVETREEVPGTKRGIFQYRDGHYSFWIHNPPLEVVGFNCDKWLPFVCVKYETGDVMSGIEGDGFSIYLSVAEAKQLVSGLTKAIKDAQDSGNDD